MRRLIHMRTTYLGPDELLVAAKLDLDPTMNVPEVSATINAAEDRLRSSVPSCKVVYLEPDLTRAVEATRGGTPARHR